MWTMGYNDGGPDSFNGGRKLRPLMPRLSSCPTAAAANTNSDNRYNMVVTMTAEQNKRELMMLNSEPQHPPVMVSSRWNPTPDQLRVLEELYRQGTRTPSADHIQQITSQLRRYGKIEGKNVFYWFQNHKARERQKRRRQMESTAHEDSVLTSATLVSNHGFNKKDPAAGYKVEHTKNWICSVGYDTQPEKPHDHQEEAVYRRIERNGRCGGDDRRSILGRNSTLQMMHLAPGLYPSSHHHHHHHHRNLILNSTIVSSNISTSNSTDSAAKDTTTVSPAVFLQTRTATNLETCNDCQGQERHEDCSNGELDHEEQTLELFPLRKEGFVSNGGDGEKERESAIHCFYEFLPLKN